MANDKNLIHFIEYGYKPFSKTQCLMRLLLIWILSILMCLISNEKSIWLCIFLIINISISVIFCVLIVKYSKVKISRFLCDGIASLYISIILNLSAYKIFVLQSANNWIIATIFLVLLFICISISAVVVHIRIKSGGYSVKSNGKRMAVWPFLGATCGVLFSRAFLKDLSLEKVVLVLAICFLLISLIVSLGSINLLKAIILKQIEDRDYKI